MKFPQNKLLYSLNEETKLQPNNKANQNVIPLEYISLKTCHTSVFIIKKKKLKENLS